MVIDYDNLASAFFKGSAAVQWIVGPSEVPQTPADIVPVSCWLNEFQIVNSSSVAVTVWIADKQSTPIYLIPPTVLNPSGMVSGEFALGRAMRGGVTWGASGPGSHGYATGKLA